MKRSVCSLVFVPLLFAGCSLGPDYARPAAATPTAWKENAAGETATAPLPSNWWTIFRDAELDQIEQQVVTANQDLWRAAARLAEARALARLSEADLYPAVSGGTSYTRSRASGSGLESNEHHTGLDLAYEIDLWGRVRRANEAARAEATAVANDLAAVRLSLTAEAARHYLQLRSLDAERTVIEATLVLRRDALRLQETRNQAGLINEADVTRALTEVANVEAELHAVTRGRARLEHALAVLCGRPPAGFAITARSGLDVPPVVPPGLPSTLLQRRPDIAAAEAQLQAAHARIGVAKADFFPRIALTGSAGMASQELGSLFDSASRSWSFGPSVHVPLFDGGRNRANLQAAEARYEQEVATYRSAVLNAFREVEDALSDLGALAREGDAVHRALVSARDTAALANERYQKGLSSYLDVVDAQRGVFQAERQVARLHGESAVSTVLLAKAIGGGWEPAVVVAQR
jgi:multidrug efflux system outer membrane protein